MAGPTALSTAPLTARARRAAPRTLTLLALALPFALPLAMALCGVPALAGAPPVDVPVVKGGGERVISGTTLDAWGRLLEGVQIVLAPLEDPQGEPLYRARSDAYGRFLLDELSPGLYRLVAIKGGYGVLVGQVDTLAQRSLDLVLQPSGPPGEAGSRPRDASWALRLPERDVLESRENASLLEESAAGPPAGSPGRHEALVVELGREDVESGEGEGGGLFFSLAGEADVEEVGLLDFGLDHRRVGEGGALEEDATSARVRWLVPERSNARETTLGVAGAHAERVLPAERGGSALFALDQRLYELALEHRRHGSKGFAVLSASARAMEGTQRVGALGGLEDIGATGLHLGLEGSLDFSLVDAGRRHRLRGGVIFRDVDDALRLSDEGSRLATLALFGEPGVASLEALEGQSAQLFVEDRVALDPNVDFFARLSATQGEFAGLTRVGSSSLGASLRMSPRWRLEAEVGSLFGGERGSEALWRVALEHAGSHLRFGVSHARASGVAPFEGRAGFDEAPGAAELLLLTDAEGLVERFGFEARLSPGGYWPEIALSAERRDVEGALAPRLPHDLALVPTSDASRARSQRVQLDLGLARSGTFIAFAWEGVDELEGARSLFEGAGSFTRRLVKLRQRVSPSDWGDTSCYVLVRFVDQRLDDAAGAESARVALLDTRRVSGGLALAF